MQEKAGYPLVSIVISTYNGATYLPVQLNCIFEQTYPNIEVIAVDDCSPDNTVSILQSYAEKHNSLTIIENEINLGYIKNFEKAMGFANGKYIALCDQDDWWDKDKVSIMMQHIENYPMLFCDSELVDAGLNSLHKKMSDIKKLSTYKSCLVFATDNCVAGHATLITKELYSLATPFPENIPHDWWLAFNAAMHGGVKYIDKVLVHYRNHAANVIGAVKVNHKRKTLKERWGKKRKDRKIIRQRIEVFYKRCPENLKQEKDVLLQLKNCYSGFSLLKNCKRTGLFLKHRAHLLAIKKRPPLRKLIFCFKMFYKIR